MEISSMVQQYNYSIKQALGVANLRKAMNQDAQTVASLLNDMKVATAKTMEHSVKPNLGSNIDIRV
ncbi:MAG: putative motility protein [Clostridia bacterium]|nr:putative motility protein [Clostridia bacterium]